MKIKSLNIKNFKSIVDISIVEPNPFTVFVGANGSGKSNIFEALELVELSKSSSVLDLFGGFENILNKNLSNQNIDIALKFHENITIPNYEVGVLTFFKEEIHFFDRLVFDKYSKESEKTEDFCTYFQNKLPLIHRIFVSNFSLEKRKITSSNFLSLAGANLEKVLNRLMGDEIIREDISDWLSLFVPEFDRIEVQKSQYSSNEELLIYQKHYDEPFNKDLISDGTYNIIALLTAVYQSDEPQFLCIEEPENGLHPKVIKQLVNFFRSACEEKGHYIWLNTHSQTLVSQLSPEEIILVDKKEGETKIKQVKDFNLYGFEMDEAWISNALGGGLPW